MATTRNYKAIYRKYHSSKRAINNRVNHRRARRKMGLKDGDPREVDHKDKNPNNNSKSNLRVTSKKANRSRKKKPQRKY